LNNRVGNRGSDYSETQLLFTSDWLISTSTCPGAIIDLPFLSEQAERNILGLNAARLFR